ncbi:MAG: glucosylceramidase, partial [bacterium]
MASSCQNKEPQTLDAIVIQTSAEGDKLTRIETLEPIDSISGTINIKPTELFQTITGFGGAFTESSASVLNKLSR